MSDGLDVAGSDANSFSATSSGNSVSIGLSSASGSSGRTRSPGVSVTNNSLSACKAVATEVATSSMVRLKASPVGEKPNGEINTIEPAAKVCVMPATSTLRTKPECWKSTPSKMPTGRAVMKLPEITRTVAPAIGVLGKPWLNAASIS